MVDRFAWAADELIPGDEIEDVEEETSVQEGRHSAPWREDMVTRDGEGQFASGGGGGSGAGGSSGGGGSRGGDSSGSHDSASTSTVAPSTTGTSAEQDRKARHAAQLAWLRKAHAEDVALAAERTRMAATDPDAINRRAYVPSVAEYDPRTDVLTSTVASEDIPTKQGTITAYRVAGNDDHTYVKSGDRTVVLNEEEINRIRHAVDDPYGQGQGDDDDNESADGPLVGPDGYHFGAVRAVGKGRVSVDIDGSPAFELSPKEARALVKAHERLDYARRLIAEYDTVDVVKRGRDIALRTKGEGGTPVEMQFKPSNLRRVARALSNLRDDEADSSQKVKTEQGEFVLTRDTPPGEDPAITIAMPNGRTFTFDTEDQQWEFQDALNHAVDESARRGVDGNDGTVDLTEARDIGEHVLLTEAAPGQAVRGRRFRARLIAGDVQGSSGYYPAAMLRKNAAVFRQGLPVYLDHPGITEQHERPERSVRDLAGRLGSTAVYERDGLYADVEVYPHWADVIEAMADDIGMSIRAAGTVEASTRHGIRGPIVTALTEASSVDFVTAAGAGGKLVQLLESARAGNLAPPFKSKKDKAKDDDEDEKPDDDDGDETDGDEDEDDAKKKGKKGKLPAFLKAKFAAKESDLAEAATVGAALESHIHSVFTQLADGMYGEGRLTRSERKSLSSAIGEALDAFTSRIEAETPDLYQRDLWADPVGAMTKNTDMGGAPMTEGTNTEQAPPERGINVAEAARDTALAEALAEAQRASTAFAERIEALEAKIAEGDAKTLRLENDKAARTACAEALKTSGLPAASHTRVTESIVRSMPTDANGALDTAKLTEAIKAGIDDKRSELAEALEFAGVGVVRGLGESRADTSDGDIDKQLEEAFAGLGLNESATRVAVYGRN